MTWPAKGQDLNPTENLWWKFKNVLEKAPFNKVDLLTAIRESWNHFEEEYCFK